MSQSPSTHHSTWWSTSSLQTQVNCLCQNCLKFSTTASGCQFKSIWTHHHIPHLSQLPGYGAVDVRTIAWIIAKHSEAHTSSRLLITCMTGCLHRELRPIMMAVECPLSQKEWALMVGLRMTTWKTTWVSWRDFMTLRHCCRTSHTLKIWSLPVCLIQLSPSQIGAMRGSGSHSQIVNC